MKINTPILKIEIETIFIIIVFISIFSQIFQNYMLSYYICYLFILFHELAHMLISSLFGINVKGIKFTISGVSINIDKHDLYNDKLNFISIIRNIIIYLAGPISNIILAFTFHSIEMVFEINIFLAIVNLLPIYPLDGYNILKNILLLKNKYIEDRILDNIENAFMSILFVIAIFQFVLTTNISIFIFVLYVYMLKQISKKDRKIANIIDYLTY